MAERTRWKVGDAVSARVLVAPDDSRVAIPPVSGWTHLQFRRFAGCPICSLHLAKLGRRRAEIEAACVVEVVVFRSSDDALRSYHAEVPFACVADPEGVLYAEFGVRSSPRSLLHPRAMVTYVQGVAAAGSLLGSLSRTIIWAFPPTSSSVVTDAWRRSTTASTPTTAGRWMTCWPMCALLTPTSEGPA